MAPGSSLPSAAGWFVVAVALVAASTTVVASLPALDPSLRSPAAHIAIETAGVIVAFVAAVVCFARVGRRRALGDVLLFAALSLLATVNTVFALIPSIAEAGDVRFSTWAAVAGRIVAACGFLTAAVIGDRPLADPRRARARATAAVLASAAAIGVAAAVLHDELPLGVEAHPDAEGVIVHGDALINAAQLLSAGLYGSAGWLFLRRRFASEAGAHTLLPVAMMLAAGARLNYFLVPSLFTDYVYLGDVLRLGFYLAILAAVLSDILSYERRLSTAAVIEERQRLARDLHDGLAQELAYISAQAQRLTEGGAARHGEAIARSAERALRESRYAISALMEPPGGEIGDVLRRAADEAVRGMAVVTAKAPAAHDVSPEAREALRRIVAEAAGNAVRHGGAGRIDVTLDSREGLTVRVTDDGRGFDPATASRPGSYGLTTMRERAEALGGSVDVRSAPGSGTVVEVRLP